jgi:kynureninase
MIEEAGLPAIQEKAQLGTELMLALFDEWLAPLGFSLITPRDPNRRGGHISIAHTDAKKIAAALRSVKNVIPDFRSPNGIRLAIAPLPTSFTEVYDGFTRLRDLVQSGDYLLAQDNGSRVT